MTEVDGDLVFLDARRNAYSCVPRTRAGAVLALLRAETHDRDLADELVRAGLVRPAPMTVLPPAPPPRSARGDFHDLAGDDLQPGLRDWLRLAAAALEAAIQFRRGPRAWLAPRRTLEASDLPLSRICALAARFDRMRPWFPFTGRCIASSLMLRAYLRRHGIEVRWVFGVATFPFEAHCWLEHEGIVLNDTFEHASWYAPIAAV